MKYYKYRFLDSIFTVFFKHNPWFQPRETLSDMRCVPVVETTGYISN